MFSVRRVISLAVYSVLSIPNPSLSCLLVAGAAGSSPTHLAAPVQ